jgi:hypothetical protein
MSVPVCELARFNTTGGSSLASCVIATMTSGATLAEPERCPSLLLLPRRMKSSRHVHVTIESKVADRS